MSRTARPTKTGATTATLVLLLLAAAGAGAAEGKEPAHAAATGLEQRVDISLNEADVTEVLASFGHIFGSEADIDPAIRGEVTVELHHVRAATVLTAVCESVGCRWWIEDGRLKIEKDPDAPPAPTPAPAPGRAEGSSAARLDQLIDMRLENADLRETLRAFGKIVQVPVTLDPSLEGRVTVDLHNTPVREALDAICRMQGCAWELEETPEGPALTIIRRR